MQGVQPAVPAASVILVRERKEGFEVLLLKRNPDLAYLGGAWVFPGGRVEKKDRKAGEGESDLEAAARAAIRETREECGMGLDRSELIPASLWITPEGLPRRFSTWFFLAVSPSGSVRVDGSEIHHHRWMSPREALGAHRSGDMFFAPPNFVILSELASFFSVGDLVEQFKKTGAKDYRPRLVALSEGLCSIYEEDEEYHGEGLRPGGMRHRLWMRDSGWVYEKNF